MFKSLLKLMALTFSLVALNPNALAFETPRLITLSPHLTEMVFDLDLGAQLVAVDESSNFPAEVKNLPKVGSGLNPNQELLLLYQPDILLSFAPSPALEKLLQTQDVELIISQPDSASALFTDWRRVLASAQQDPQKAAATEYKIKTIEKAWHETQLKYADKASKTAFFLISDQPLYSLSDKTFLSQAFKVCNMQNIFSAVNQPSFIVNPEELLLKQPEIIIHGYHAAAVDGKSRSRQVIFKRLKEFGLEIRPEQLISVDVDILHRPTMRFIKALPQICETIHHADDT